MPIIWKPARTAMFAGAAVATLAFGATATHFAIAEGAKSPDDPVANRQQVEAVIRDYLLEHPELLIEVMDKLQQKQDADQSAAAKEAIAKNRTELNSDGYSYVAGNKDGDVTIVEFFDYNCGFCKKVRPSLVQLIEEDKNVRIVLKEFPVLHDRAPGSMVSARAAMTVASTQGDKYWAFHNQLLSNEGVVTEARVFEIAAEVQIDVEKLKKDMADPSVDQRLERNGKLAEALKIDGTPAFIIGDTLAPGAMELDEIKKLVAEARAKCETC